jgi:hypothetical protein
VAIAPDGSDRDRAAGEPWAAQLAQCRLASNQGADSGRVAEDLVEGDRNEVGVPDAQVQSIGRHERGCIQQDIPALILCTRDPVKRVPNTREVGLRGVGEKVGRIGAGLIEIRRQPLLVDPHGRRKDGCVGHPGSSGPRKLANAVDGVVVVEGQEIVALRRERIGLADEAQGSTCVLSEADHVFVGRGIEESEYLLAGTIDPLGRRY